MPIATTLMLGALMTIPQEPTVTPFAHGKSCAFSLEYDDSMTSQVKNLLPLLKQYRFPVTFYINPGRPQYQAVREVWEKEIPAAGHELADHTWNHGDTVGAAKAESEIAPVAKLIEKIVGHKVLTVFGTPGGVKWDIPKADLERILRDNRLFSPGREDFYQDGQGDITRFPKKALDSKGWHRLGFHGVGGEWLSTSVENMTTLFQFLDQHRNDMWIAPTGTVWKYMREREALAKLDVEPMADGIVIKPTFDPDKFEDMDLYDVPLTMKVPVPANWSAGSVSLDGKKGRTVPAENGFLLVDFAPQVSSIRITKG